MRRLFRWAFNGAVAVSSVLLVVLAVEWVRSTKYHDFIYWRNWRLASYPGVVRFARLADWDHLTFTVRIGSRNDDWYDTDQVVDYDPNDKIVMNDIYGGSSFEFPATTLMIKDWAAVIIASAIPVAKLGFVAFAVLRRRQRRLQGFCLSCGYDLRASPDRCPECGNVPARKAAT